MDNFLNSRLFRIFMAIVLFAVSYLTAFTISPMNHTPQPIDLWYLFVSMITGFGGVVLFVIGIGGSDDE